MKAIMVVPTYWGRDSETGWQLGDEIYDHPTPLDQEGTLGRLIDSMHILENRDFELIILIAVTTPEIRDEAYEKVKEILKEKNLPIKTYLVGDEQLSKIKNIYIKNHPGFSINLLSLCGYPSIRNMCLYTAYLIGADVVVLIDDDEVIKDSKLMNKTLEFVGGRLYGQTVDGIAGYYLNKNNEYYDDVEIEPWMTFWNRFGCKAKAFDKIIGSSPRLKQTPFAFGGLMVIHKNLYKVVPFDPELTRGEDIDYLINARMFGFNFFLDNELSILHLSPGKKHAVWQRFRQDIYRFFYERAKIITQEERPNMNKVEPEDFNPYPGEFLKPDLEDKVFKTNLILALDYLSENDIENAKSTIKNIYLSKYDAEPTENVFRKYLLIQENWDKLLKYARDNLGELSDIIKDTHLKARQVNTVKHKKIKLDYESIFDIPFFNILNEDEQKIFLNIVNISYYNPDDIIVNKGNPDDTLYLIKQGQVKVVHKKSRAQEELILTKLAAGELFGLSSLVTSKTAYYLAEIIALEPVTLLSIKKQDLMIFFDKEGYHKTSIKILLHLIKELNKQIKELAEMYTNIQLKTQDISDSID